MANINAPFGGKPVGHLNGSTYNGQANLYYFAASNGDAVHIGDFVKSKADGDANGVRGVDLAAGTDKLRGIIVGVLGVYPGVSMEGTALNLEQPGYIAAANAAAQYVLVADAPDLVFEIQCGSVATNLTAVKGNLNCSLTIAAPSPTTQPRSATIVDNSTIDTTNTLNIKLLGLARKPNNALGAYQIVNATYNLHELLGGSTAI